MDPSKIHVRKESCVFDRSTLGWHIDDQVKFQERWREFPENRKIHPLGQAKQQWTTNNFRFGTFKDSTNSTFRCLELLRTLKPKPFTAWDCLGL
ncbi:hypothetical protein J6590_104291 [Homalodisca vitripennis]|nr:hypothetical protein J6590_104291 [Homalodisca vitripennis]